MGSNIKKSPKSPKLPASTLPSLSDQQTTSNSSSQHSQKSQQSQLSQSNPAVYSSPTTEVNFESDVTIPEIKIDATPTNRVNFSQSIEIIDSNLTENDDDMDGDIHSFTPSSHHISSGSISLLNDSINDSDLAFISKAIEEIQTYTSAERTGESTESQELISNLKESLVKSRQLLNQINFKNKLFKISIENQFERNEMEKTLLTNQLNILNRFNYMQSVNDKQKVNNAFQILEKKNIIMHKNLQKVLIKNKNLKIKVVEQEAEISSLKRKVKGGDAYEDRKEEKIPINLHIRTSSTILNENNKKIKLSNNSPSQGNMLDTLGYLASQVLLEDRNKSNSNNTTINLNEDTSINNDKTVDLDETIDLPHSSVIIR